jgi:hypothetical protein
MQIQWPTYPIIFFSQEDSHLSLVFSNTACTGLLCDVQKLSHACFSTGKTLNTS